MCSLEDHVAFLLAGTAERREEAARRVAELARDLDWPRLLERLKSMNVLGLIGTRLLDVPGASFDPEFDRHLEHALEHTRRRALLVEVETLRLWGLLEDAGIRAVAVKGPFMARSLHGDAALRPSNDVDLLVKPADFTRALDTLGTEGYVPVKGTLWREGLPLFETTLHAAQRWRPPVDLHWRMHWYDTSYTDRFVDAATAHDGEPRRPTPIDELVMLLLVFSRDGLWGLRPVADVAAWWDLHGDVVGADCLRPVVEEYPKFRDALSAALRVMERLGGVPAGRLLASAGDLGPRAARASRLARWCGDDPDDYHAMVSLIDLLLAPGGERFASVQRHLLPPPDAIDRIYDVPRDARLRHAFGRLRYASIVGTRLLPRQARALWLTRGDRPMAPPPPI